MPLHWQIIAGLLGGAVYGLCSASFGWSRFTSAWIVPFGDIFLNLLKLIAVPLVIGSLATGVASLSDMRKLSRIGGKTITLYLLTTSVAVMIGLVLASVLQPGERIQEDLRRTLHTAYEAETQKGIDAATVTQSRGPLQILVDMVPDNIVNASGNNRDMLKVVFFAVLFGIALILIPPEKAKPLLDVLDGLTHAIVKIVELVMRVAPIGVFGLIVKTIQQVAGNDPAAAVDLLRALGWYTLTVVAGLSLHMYGLYGAMLRLFSPMGVVRFFRSIAPAQLLAFSSSSSGATLPVSMAVTEKRLGVPGEITAFALPLGATVNMDGTALYQGVATVFIATAFGMGLDFTTLATIVLTATLASIGSAPVPGAGLIMLIVVLESAGVPASGVALVLGVDRILDMCRTVVNVTGDMAVATVVAASEGQLEVQEKG
ncbi:MAG: dicarboxylate/amino acid:cation symporter [candidate division Zixibacteria bacterium]|nr:dicarboxylate/amino acid:cation symporter [candidate division Zixibacteria bacterium]